MPTTLAVDPTLPILARRFPLAAAVLSEAAHAGFLLGQLTGSDVRRMSACRERVAGIPSVDG